MEELKEANTTLQYARSALSEAKKKYTEAETNLINAKLFVAKLNEELRVIKAQQVDPTQKYDLYDDEG